MLAGYHFVYSWHDGANQAAFAIEVAAQLGLPVVPDFERVAKGERETDAPHLARVTALAFLRHHRNLTGYAAVTYGPAFYLRDMKLEGPDVGPLWVADTRSSPPAPLIPPPWTRPVLWQHVHNEVVAGAKEGTTAAVDWNYSDLSIDELARVFRGEPGTPMRSTRPFIGPAETFTNRDEGPVIG